jgi:NAD(P)-dependent dehydrogenase (short-subunit alcohol dehydrogenase family)
MKIIVIGATGTIGSEVVKALSLKRHEVVRASRNGEVKVTLDDPASVRALFERVRNVDAVVSCAGNTAFKPFADLTDADYELGLRSKLMGQVSLARAAKDALRDSGSITLTTGVLAMQPMPGSASISLVNAGLEGFVRAAALEMPRGLRINAVSPPWVKETMVKFGMDPTPGLASADVAKAYVETVEGSRQGEILSGDSICLMARGLRRRSGRPRASSSAGPSATVRAPARKSGTWTRSAPGHFLSAAPRSPSARSRHIASALARLADGGRLVAITGASFSPDAPAGGTPSSACRSAGASCSPPRSTARLTPSMARRSTRASPSSTNCQRTIRLLSEHRLARRRMSLRFSVGSWRMCRLVWRSRHPRRRRFRLPPRRARFAAVSPGRRRASGSS